MVWGFQGIKYEHEVVKAHSDLTGDAFTGYFGEPSQWESVQKPLSGCSLEDRKAQG